MKRTAMRGREAFTLIELLVVISIIAILMALTTAGVMKVRVAAKRAQTANEVGQLSSAIGVFQRDKKQDSIPSRLVLRERMDYNSANILEVESANYLKRVWPQLPIALSTTGNSPFGPGVYLDWNGNSTLNANPVTLEGDQCLVFFLGGIPVPQPDGTFAASGFSNNPANPTDAASRKSPSFEFPSGRLKDFHSGTGFPSFIDPFGTQPYVFFSSYGTKATGSTYSRFGGSDCPTAGISPYIQTASPLSYWQPTGHQIVSAGYDKLFGVGGLAPGPNTVGGQPDADNITNFSNGQISSLGN